MACGCGGSNAGQGGCGDVKTPPTAMPETELAHELAAPAVSTVVEQQAVDAEPLLIASSEQEWPRVRVNGVAIAPEASLERFARFEDVVALIKRMRDVKLLVEVESHLRLANYSPGRIEFEPTPEAPRDLAQVLGARLQSWTGARWGVSVVSTGGGRTIKVGSESGGARVGGLDRCRGTAHWW